MGNTTTTSTGATTTGAGMTTGAMTTGAGMTTGATTTGAGMTMMAATTTTTAANNISSSTLSHRGQEQKQLQQHSSIGRGRSREGGDDFQEGNNGEPNIERDRQLIMVQQEQQSQGISSASTTASPSSTIAILPTKQHRNNPLDLLSTVSIQVAAKQSGQKLIEGKCSREVSFDQLPKNRTKDIVEINRSDDDDDEGDDASHPTGTETATKAAGLIEQNEMQSDIICLNASSSTASAIAAAEVEVMAAASSTTPTIVTPNDALTTKDIVEIDSSSDESDEGDNTSLRMKAYRIAIGTKVFKTNCKLVFQFNIRQPYIQLSFEVDGKSRRHRVFIDHNEELKMVKYHIAPADDTVEGEVIGDILSVIVFRIRPSGLNDLTRYRDAYNQEGDGGEDVTKNYISVDPSNNDQFEVRTSRSYC